MKKQTGIWIDTSKAIVVTLTNGEDEIREVKSEIENRIYHEKEGDKGSFMGNRHINHEKTFEERKHQQTDRFLQEVVQELKNTQEVYVFGPAEMKLKLKQKIENDNTLAAQVKSMETADSMTLNQVVAQVKQFFAEQ